MHAFNLHYLDTILDEMAKKWPENRTINIVCHGHSVPSGYFATPRVNAFGAYPHLLHRLLAERFPFSVNNVIVTAIGGETSVQGERRFDAEVLTHRPDVLTLDYALNDRREGVTAAKAAWSAMIERALARDIKIILLTPSWDTHFFTHDSEWELLRRHAEQVRELAAQYQVGLADVFARFEAFIRSDADAVTLLSHGNHPSKKGHEMIAEEIGKYFLAR